MSWSFTIHTELTTPLSPNEVAARLRAEVAREVPFFTFRPSKWYPALRGTVGARQFKLVEDRHLQRHTDTRMHGTIHPEGEGSRLSLDLKPAWAIWFQLTVLTLILGSGELSAMGSTKRGHWLFAGLILVGLLLFYRMTAFQFRTGADSALSTLQALLAKPSKDEGKAKGA